MSAFRKATNEDVAIALRRHAAATKVSAWPSLGLVAGLSSASAGQMRLRLNGCCDAGMQAPVLLGHYDCCPAQGQGGRWTDASVRSHHADLSAAARLQALTGAADNETVLVDVTLRGADADAAAGAEGHREMFAGQQR